MATANGIKSVAADVRNERTSISSKNNYFERIAVLISYNWKGKAGESFTDTSKRTKKQIESVIGGHGDLYTKLSKLADSIKRAENDDKKAAKQ